MKLTVDMANKRLLQTLADVRKDLRKGPAELVKAGARLAVRKAIEMTPPFNMRDNDDSLLSGSKNAQTRGENAILTDAIGGKRGSAGKTKRSGIFFVADERLLKQWHSQHPNGQIQRLFVKKDGTVWATENQYYKPNASIADMDAHHAKYWKNGRMTSGGAYDKTIGRTVFVDRMVVGKGAMQRWFNYKKKRVGFLAAGWLDAANKLKVARVPAWIKRHGAPGGYREEESPGNFVIYAINSVPAGQALQLQRIIPAALAAASAGMRAQARHITLKRLKKAGLMTTITSFA